MIGNPDGGGPQTSRPCLSARGAATTTTCPSAPAAARRRDSVSGADGAGTRTSTTPDAGWASTREPGGTAAITSGLAASGTMARSTTSSSVLVDQSRAASQKADEI